MTDRRWEHVKTVTLFGTVLAGCQEVSLTWEMDQGAHSGCDQDAVQYRSVRRLRPNISIKLEGGTSYEGELHGVSFDGSAIAEAKSGELKEMGSEKLDSADADHFITWIGTHERSVEASITTRKIDTVGALDPGAVGTLIMKSKVGKLTDGAIPVGTGSEVVYTALTMQVQPTQIDAKHSDLAESKIDFAGNSGVKTFTGGEGSDHHPGDEGELSWVVPTADGGSDKTYTVSNFHLQERAVAFKEGDNEFTFTGKAYSDSGAKTDSPLAIS
jgi:hypothetical protein